MTVHKHARILVADHNRVISEMLTRFLERIEYQAEWVTDGETALRRVLYHEYDLVMVDIFLPRMSGLEMLQEVKQRGIDLPFILMTAQPTFDNTKAAIQFGAFDFLIKPFDLGLVRESVSRAVAQYRSIQQKKRTIEQLVRQFQSQGSHLRSEMVSSMASFVSAIEAKLPESYGHGKRVCRLVLALAKRFDVDEESLESLRLAGLLHDIGMIGIPDQIIHKPGNLSEDEVHVLQKHVEVGCQVLSPITEFSKAIRYIREHHERLDGSGYPRGIRKHEIHPFSHFLIVAEVFDALSTIQPFRPAWSLRKIREYFDNTKGKLFDEQVVQTLLSILDEYGESFYHQVIGEMDTEDVYMVG